ncbi:hypothetical protein COCCADRAFT_24185 [Bipolaris zeicola 26-R-13]|uniref:Uncharacterized protein n=1 Tax=Cochliobolus carbonum (strain 26-R-13) TaxID=930089 RepID=W6YWK0_COCC2|nr:uncharacterized protein COCCADRAFT_24185 [Bipolaris zeicola 26-R-13]EUC35891.1 hypothetical protein COCCADRAFT_24185 [Bipolaris zeicola 26-R-13]
MAVIMDGITTGAHHSGLCQGHRQRALNCQPALLACLPVVASLTSARQQADSRRTNSHLGWLHPPFHGTPRALRAALHHAMMHTTARPPWSSMSLQYPRPPLHVSLWALACTRPQIAPLERHASPAGEPEAVSSSRRLVSLTRSPPRLLPPSTQVPKQVVCSPSRSRPPAWRKASPRAASARPPALFHTASMRLRPHGGTLDGWPRSAPRQRLREVIRPSGRAGPDAISALAVQQPAAPPARPLNTLPSPPPLHLHHHPRLHHVPSHWLTCPGCSDLSGR